MNMGKNKIALGTAQFGMDYGINNNKGKIPKDEVFEILTESLKFNIDILDTAYAYGESELVIGDFIKNNQKQFKIISKLPECTPEKVTGFFEESLKRLGVDSLYGYMIHSFQQYQKNPQIWEILKDLRSHGKIKKIGFSLYYPFELDHLLDNGIEFDMIQVPYNIFDQRFGPYFPKLNDKDVEIYVRSVFLQGLVFKNPSQLDEYFAAIKEKLRSLHLLCAKMDVPVVALCLNFAILNKFVDRVVVGVDSSENLKEIVSSGNYIKDIEDVYDDLRSFKVNDEKIILPFNWKVIQK
jgi:aryl-alcohol dehydrogenase-like predicted oxidoreductase